MAPSRGGRGGRALGEPGPADVADRQDGGRGRAATGCPPARWSSLLLGAANRDPARFADPDRFDILRRDLGHLAFGAGVHVCLGAFLARLETQVAVGALLRRWPTLQLATDRPAWRPTATLRGLATLPVTW